MDPLALAAARLEQRAAAGDPVLNARRAWGPCDRADCDGMPHEGWPDRHARPQQVTPGTAGWLTWLILAGRGYGKTRTGAEDLAWYMIEHPGVRCAILAPTFADARDTCVEGESGLLAVLARYGLDENTGLVWNRSLGEMILPNGSRAKLFSAEKPARLRGPQHHRAWVDELAQVVKDAPDAWDMLLFGLRLGVDPQVVATTTPLPVQVVRELVARAGQDVILTRGSTFDNSANLAPAMLQQLRTRYEGTRLGRQELFADLLDDLDGALWQRTNIDAARIKPADLPQLVRVVVAVDPAVTSGEESDETGIVVVGEDGNGHGYVLADYSLRGTPDECMRKAVWAYHEHEADCVVAEVNNGGDYIGTLLAAVDPNVPYRQVRASRGKAIRAEPVAALYEQHRMHHVGNLPHLEDQQCMFVPGKDSTKRSHDDRVDALVWAATELRGLSAGSWQDAYGTTTCGRCHRGYLRQVDGQPRTACPHCGAPTVDDEAA